VVGAGSSGTAASGGRGGVVADAGAAARSGGSAGVGQGGNVAASGTGSAGQSGSAANSGTRVAGQAGQSGAAGEGGVSGATGAGQGGTAANGGAGGNVARTTSFRNPLNRAEGSDPWLVYHEGFYYLTATTWSSRLTIARASTLDGLRSAEPATVWEGDEPRRCCNFWAPELHLLDGRWYLYYTAGPSGMNTDNQRMHVLESEGSDPLGPYHYKARLFDPAIDLWAIDASVFRLNDKLYYVWSAWEGDNQNLYIAAMRNPWTLEGARRRLSTPTYPWERELANVNEGGVALQHGDDTFIVYSASACWGAEYKLGMLRYMGGDPLSESSWRKHSEPVFERADDNRAFGPGHNGFFKSPDGSEDWIVYHANDSAAGVCDTKRTTRAQKVNWKADGTPDFGVPAPLDKELPGPSGE
jgi:GH43 family beta-xylosidase